MNMIFRASRKNKENFMAAAIQPYIYFIKIYGCIKTVNSFIKLYDKMEKNNFYQLCDWVLKWMSKERVVLDPMPKPDCIDRELYALIEFDKFVKYDKIKKQEEVFYLCFIEDMTVKIFSEHDFMKYYEIEHVSLTTQLMPQEKQEEYKLKFENTCLRYSIGKHYNEIPYEDIYEKLYMWLQIYDGNI